MSKLDSNQQDAVNAITGNAVIIAGAGSGKTRVLVHMLAYLVEEGADPGRIILTTFTKRAASEMRERAGQLSGQSLDGLMSGTLHSVALQILKDYVDPGIRIISQEEALGLVEEMAADLLVERNEEELGGLNYASLLESVSRRRESGLDEDVSDRYDRQSFVRELLNRYSSRKRAEGWLDYSDLLICFRDWLVGEEGSRWSSKLEAVLIDEAQDLNHIQRDIINLLSNGPAVLALIGDPGQCIYSWRGAAASAMIDASQDASVKLIRMANNYRSTPEIVALANAALPRGPLAQEMVARRPLQGVLPEAIVSESVEAEAEQIAEWIEAQDDAYHECAILGRTHKHLNKITDALNVRGIPVELLGQKKKDGWQQLLVAFLRLAENEKDRLAWRDILTAAGGEERMEDILNSSRPLRSFVDSGDDNISQLVKMLEDEEPSPSLWRRLCYGPFGAMMADAGEGERALALAEKVADDVFWLEEQDELERTGVAVGTVHAAKGLEWTSVAIAHIGNGSFPLARGPVDEEERLFYVALTRARDRLLLSKADWLEGPNLVDRYRELISSLPAQQ